MYQEPPEVAELKVIFEMETKPIARVSEPYIETI
jgi:hypothetical protein